MSNKHIRTGKYARRLPILPLITLAVIAAACFLCPFFLHTDPSYMELGSTSAAPCATHLFGTDTMGRDIFAGIWYGGRISLGIGLLAALISTIIAFIIGAFSGLAPDAVDAATMRITDILLSIPSLPLVILLQAVLGYANVLSLSMVLGLTGWMNMAKLVSTEVKQLRDTEYVIAAKCMGGGFFYILRRHLAPNIMPSVIFMSVMNIRSAIIAESTLSFMGMGLSTETITWGSMLSLADKAFMTGAWWIIIIPGAFLALTLLSITDIANVFGSGLNKRHSNLV